MKLKQTKKSCISQIFRVLCKWGIPLILVGAFSVSVAGEAKAASSWNPTLLVNTESFNVIDDGDGTTDIEVRFGETVDERIRWMINENRFEFSRDVRVAGNITATGSIAASGSLAADANLTINADNGGADAVITFGNDAGAETITFSDSTNQFEVSDDLKTTGNFESDGNGTFQGTLEINDDNNGNATLTFGNDAGDETIIFNDGTEEFDISDDVNVTGTLDTTGNITTDANLTINEDNGDADAVLTFGNDAGAKALTYSNANTRFEFNDDVHVTGTLETTGNLTVGGTVTLGGVTYTFPASDGAASGRVLKTDGAGNLTWATDIDTDTNTQLTAEQVTDYVGGMVSGNTETLISVTFQDGDNTLDFAVDEASINHDALTNFVANEHISWVAGDGASANLETTGSISGATIHAQDSLTSSGVLSIEGPASFGSTVELNGVTYTFPVSDGVSSGKVLATDGAGNLVWTTDMNDAGIGITLDSGDNRYVNTVGDTMTGDLIIEGADLTASGIIVTENATISGALSVDGTSSLVGAITAGSTIDAVGNITTDANLTINEDNGGADAVLTFGNDAGAETLTFSDSTNQFELSDDFQVTGNLDVNGNETVSGTLEINDDNTGNATLTFGNDAGDETIIFNDATNEFDISDDVNVTGTLDTTGNITTDANLTINEDNGNVDAVLTFGNDAGAKALTYSNANTRFEFGDDVSVTGTMNVSSNLSASGVLSVEGNISTDGNISGSTLTVDGDITLHGVTYSAPVADGSRGEVLTTDGAGNLVWSGANLGIGSGGVVAMSPEYPNAVYFNSGSVTNYIGQMTYDYDETNNENFYRWTSSKGALQEYWISARIRIPDNFKQWDSSRPIQYMYRTGTANAADNFLTMRLYDTSGTEIALTGANDLKNTSWTTATITGPDSSGTFTTGEYITVAIKMSATSAGSADSGFINLNFETSAP